jgi:hypothetical protein
MKKTNKISSERDKQRVIAEIKALDVSEKAYKNTLEDYREIRSLSQNNLMWLWFKVIEYETGNTKEYLHDLFREKYLGYEKYEVTYPVKEIKERLISTTSLDTKEFKIYLDKIHLELSEKMPEIRLPDPKDKDFDRIIDYYSDVI